MAEPIVLTRELTDKTCACVIQSVQESLFAFISISQSLGLSAGYRIREEADDRLQGRESDCRRNWRVIEG